MSLRAILRRDIGSNAETQMLFGPAGDRALRYLASLVLTVFATVIAVGVDSQVAIPNVSLIFVVPVVVAAAVLGAGPSLLSAVMGALAYNYFLTEPRYTFTVDDPANILAICLLLCTGMIVSAVAGYLQRATAEAAELKRRSAIIRSFCKEATETDAAETLSALGSKALSQLFDASAAVLLKDGETLRIAARTGSIGLEDADLQAARLAADNRTIARGGVYPDIAVRWDLWPLPGSGPSRGVIGVAFQDERPATPEPAIEIVGALLSSRLGGVSPAKSSAGAEAARL